MGSTVWREGQHWCLPNVRLSNVAFEVRCPVSISISTLQLANWKEEKSQGMVQVAHAWQHVWRNQVMALVRSMCVENTSAGRSAPLVFQWRKYFLCWFFLVATSRILVLSRLFRPFACRQWDATSRALGEPYSWLKIPYLMNVTVELFNIHPDDWWKIQQDPTDSRNFRVDTTHTQKCPSVSRCI
jgi:hypothetical protein